MSVVFEFVCKPYVLKGVIALDTNLRMITAYDGPKVRRYRTRFVDALSKRKRAGEIQKKYPSILRGEDITKKEILSGIRALRRKARNIVTGSSWKFSKQIVLKALKHGMQLL